VYCRYEALAIAHGAARVTTLEYNRLQYNHPLITTVLVNDSLANAALVGAFDVAMSVSSFEHDGLGRYGDPLNPNGDLIAMRNTRRLLKKGEMASFSNVKRRAVYLERAHWWLFSRLVCFAGGVLLLAVPCGADALVWNIHRVYGPQRLPQLLRGWRLINA
jgi:hypothetical protein